MSVFSVCFCVPVPWWAGPPEVRLSQIISAAFQADDCWCRTSHLLIYLDALSFFMPCLVVVQLVLAHCVLTFSYFGIFSTFFAVATFISLILNVFINFFCSSIHFSNCAKLWPRHVLFAHFLYAHVVQQVFCRTPILHSLIYLTLFTVQLAVSLFFFVGVRGIYIQCLTIFFTQWAVLVWQLKHFYWLYGLLRPVLA